MVSDKTVLSANQTKLASGKVKFYNNYLPNLPAGNYCATLTQTVEADGLDEKQYTYKQEFEVAGPRFRLPEGEIHSVYPPANSEQYYEGHLPQIVFRKRTLPWERSVDSEAEDSEDYEVPYMALLVFEEHELIVDAADLKGATRTRAVSRETKELLHPSEHNYLQPVELEPGMSDEKSCYTIDMRTKDFLKIAPKTYELPYLAHVREVNTEDKEFLGMHADGWFSVLLANRLPKTPPPVKAGSLEEAKGAKFARNIVHLVSLEGFLPYLEDKNKAEKIPAQARYVRLASLASWEFYCKPPEESFTKLMEDLDRDTAMLKIHADIDPDRSDQHAYLKTALDGGYVPLQYHIRNGEQTVAWYRSPLIPVINQYDPKDEDEDVFFSAEASMIYDETQGLFDLSQAVAWQIGRLLALNDTHFSQHLLDWKKLVNRRIDQLLKRQALVQRPGVHTESVTTEGDLPEVEKVRELMSQSFAEDIFSDNFLDQLTLARQFFRDLETPSLLERELAVLPGILDVKRFEDRLEEGLDPEEALVKEVFNQ